MPKIIYVEKAFRPDSLLMIDKAKEGDDRKKLKEVSKLVFRRE